MQQKITQQNKTVTHLRKFFVWVEDLISSRCSGWPRVVLITVSFEDKEGVFWNYHQHRQQPQLLILIPAPHPSGFSSITAPLSLNKEMCLGPPPSREGTFSRGCDSIRWQVPQERGNPPYKPTNYLPCLWGICPANPVCCHVSWGAMQDVTKKNVYSITNC